MLAPLFLALAIAAETTLPLPAAPAPLVEIPTTKTASAPPPSASASAASWAKLDFRVSLGAEWDTNAMRAVDSDSRLNQDLPIVSDGVTRLVADVAGGFRLAELHTLDLGYVLGAKRFFRRQTEDLLIHDLSLATAHGFGDAFFGNTWGTLRASRVRSGARDYSLGAGGLTAGYSPSPWLTLSAGGSFTVFDFPLERHLSYLGPAIQADVTLRPVARVTFGLRADYRWRGYDRALVRTMPPGSTIPSLTYCEMPGDPPACTPAERDDTELAFTLSASYRGKLVLGGEYTARILRSSSEFENIDRHRASVFATFPLPLELVGSVAAALQLNNGVSVTETVFLAEDDENQNNLQVQLSRRISGSLSAEVRYALFANQFTTNTDASFLRQTFYLGLSYRIRPENE